MALRLHQLRALVGVVEHGGIRAASRQLHVSQAALTKSLRQIEDEAGVALLVRSPLGVRLTPAGQRLLARASLITRQLDLADQELLDEMGEQQSQLHIAITPYITLSCLGQAFRWFRQRYPRVELELIEGLVSRALPRLRDGTLDLAIVADTGDLPVGEFRSELLLSARQHIVVRTGHPVLEEPTAQALAQLEWVLTGPRDPLKIGMVRSIFECIGVEGPSRIAFCDTLAGMTLLRETDVIGLMPEPLLSQPEGRGLVPVRVPELAPAEFHVRLLTREDVPLTRAAAYMAHCLSDACRQAG